MGRKETNQTNKKLWVRVRIYFLNEFTTFLYTHLVAIRWEVIYSILSLKHEHLTSLTLSIVQHVK